MRLKVIFKGYDVFEPNQKHINSYFHKCLGNNNVYHDNKSNYCLSTMIGGKLVDGKIVINDYMYFYVTTTDMKLLEILMKNIPINNMFGKLKFDKFDIITEQHYDGYNIFRTISPILLKQKINDKIKYITINDDNFQDYLYENIKNLLKINSIPYENLKVIVNKHKSNKIKTIMVKNIKNIGTMCDIIIHCDLKTTEFIYNNGIGFSRGGGFGTIYNTKNKEIYETSI